MLRYTWILWKREVTHCPEIYISIELSLRVSSLLYLEQYYNSYKYLHAKRVLIG